ncbi:MAG: hypothetical protein ABIY52_08970 [Gemmatimonadaceae bacterium]
MKKLILIGLLFAGACRSHTVETPAPAPSPGRSAATGSNQPGADSPRLAVDAFLRAVRDKDLQALSSVWGNKDGPVRSSKTMTRDEVEQREIYLIRCLRNDSHRVLGDSPAAGGERVLQVELTSGTSRSTMDFFTAQGGDRWYVRSANIDQKRCAAK